MRGVRFAAVLLLGGLAAAPARVTAGLTIDVDGSALKSEDLQRGGRSVGVPGTLAVLSQVHQRYGKLPWVRLFAPAIELAEAGFPMPPYLHTLLSAPGAASFDSSIIRHTSGSIRPDTYY